MNYIIELLDADDQGGFLKLSAIGLARSWVDSGKPVPDSNVNTEGYTKRDDLARALVLAMQNNPSTRKVYIDMLSQARAHINAPYLDRAASGHGSPLTKPKEKKKADAAK